MTKKSAEAPQKVSEEGQKVSLTKLPDYEKYGFEEEEP